MTGRNGKGWDWGILTSSSKPGDADPESLVGKGDKEDWKFEEVLLCFTESLRNCITFQRDQDGYRRLPLLSHSLAASHSMTSWFGQGYPASFWIWLGSLWRPTAWGALPHSTLQSGPVHVASWACQEREREKRYLQSYGLLTSNGLKLIVYMTRSWAIQLEKG